MGGDTRGPDDASWYFAYGANMSGAILERRGVAPLWREAARLSGYRLVFTLPGGSLVEPAYASVEPHPEEEVHGILYGLRPPDAERLDAFEIDPTFGYLPVHVRVEGTRSGERSARTYVAAYPRRGLRPSRRYVRILTEAAREAGLPPAYVARIAAHPSAYVPILSELVGASISFRDRWNAWLNEDDPD